MTLLKRWIIPALLAVLLLFSGASAEEAVGPVPCGDWLVEPMLCAQTDYPSDGDGYGGTAPVIVGTAQTAADAPAYNALRIVKYTGKEAHLIVPKTLTVVISGREVTLDVVEVGENAFAENRHITGVVLHEGIRRIGAGAFYRCTALEKAVLPAGLERLGRDVFFGCAALREVSLPEGLAQLEAGCFEGCVSLMRVDIPESTVRIERDAFKNCTALSEVSLPRRVAYIGGHAFLNTKWLEAQQDAWVIVGDGVLLACRRQAQELSVPTGVRMISSAFEGHDELRGITLCEGVEAVGEYAFADCDALEEIRLPGSVRSIAAYAFADCTALSGVLTGKKIDEIGEYAFLNCASLNALQMGEGLERLGAGAFSGCVSLREMVLCEGLERLEARTFENCRALEEVCVPLSVTSIADDAFSGARNVLVRAVYGSTGERYARAHGLSCVFLRQENGEYVYERTARGIEIVEYIGNAAVLEMPDELDGVRVTSIGAGAFEEALSLRSVTLSAGIERVEDWAFAGLYRLEQVMLPAGLKELGAEAFDGCVALREIYLPEGLRTLDEGTFEDCAKLRVLADADSEIFDLAQAAGLQTVDILTEYDAFRYEKRGAALKVSGYRMDERMLSLPAQYAGRAVTAVGAGAFEGGEWTVVLPEGYEALESGAFRGCTHLDITLPESLTEIAGDALIECENVTIRGYVGSAAEEYARRAGCRFIVRHER